MSPMNSGFVGYRRPVGVMRVDMVERVALLVRTAARGPVQDHRGYASLAGATREQMSTMLLDTVQDRW